jgi:hypothetical protein
MTVNIQTGRRWLMIGWAIMTATRCASLGLLSP